MKEVYVLRHGEKGPDGALTDSGKRAAEAMHKVLPLFARVISSDSSRAVGTAERLAGSAPTIDTRAAYATTSAEISSAIDEVAREHNVSFLEAARIYGDPEVLDGIDQQAHALNELIVRLLEGLEKNQQALIVSHDLTITPAMELRGVKTEPIGPLGGYVIRMVDEEVSVHSFAVQ